MLKIKNKFRHFNKHDEGKDHLGNHVILSLFYFIIRYMSMKEIHVPFICQMCHEVGVEVKCQLFGYAWAGFANDTLKEQKEIFP